MEQIKTIDKAKIWLQKPFDEETQKTVQNLIENNPEELEDAFYKNLEFGTGGMRGIMGIGTNRLNKYTLGQATQALATYLKEQFPNENIKVAIAYDVRNNSKQFGKIVADVLTANNITVLLFKEHRPTPELSFTVRNKKCHAGIVLTASHNPPEYNGYKVYWNDGAQITPPHDENIIQKVNNTKFHEINFSGNDNLIEWIDQTQDNTYIQACMENSLYQKNKINYNDVNIVFTPIHGTTYTTIPKALETAGFNNVTLVTEQMEPNGNFPTVKSPNPEEPEALDIAINIAKTKNADIVIGCDPDGDRLGIAIKNQNQQIQLLNGNQCNTLLTHYILEQWKENNKITGKEFIGSTIVTSDIFIDLAKKFNINCKIGLTGFKWIGKMIREAEGKEKFICGGEESFGFMTGDFLRDKDSCGSILTACEMVAWCKSQNKTPYQYLIEIYNSVGLYKEDLINIVKKGKTGSSQIKQIMSNLRENPPTHIAQNKITEIHDYLTLQKTNTIQNIKQPITDIPKSNVLIFYTQDGTKLCVRPSGTEPKIKFYISVKDKIENIEQYNSKIEILENKINQIKEELKKY